MLVAYLESKMGYNICIIRLLSTIEEDNKRLAVVTESGHTEVDTVRLGQKNINFLETLII